MKMPSWFTKNSDRTISLDRIGARCPICRCDLPITYEQAIRLAATNPCGSFVHCARMLSLGNAPEVGTGQAATPPRSAPACAVGFATAAR